MLLRTCVMAPEQSAKPASMQHAMVLGKGDSVHASTDGVRCSSAFKQVWRAERTLWPLCGEGKESVFQGSTGLCVQLQLRGMCWLQTPYDG